MALVDAVAHRLSDEMGAERPDSESVTVEQLADPTGVAVVGEGLVDLEVVAPACELEPVEPDRGRLGGKLLERQVGPLAGEESDRARHRRHRSDAHGCSPETSTRPYPSSPNEGPMTT